VASFLSTAAQEGTAAVLPAFFVGTLRATPLTLGAVEAGGHAAGTVARMVGAELGVRTHRRRALSVIGHGGITVGSALIALAGSVWAAGIPRAASWAARGLRTPLRPAQTTEVAPRELLGYRLGIERSVDSLGAAVGALVALGLLSVLGVRSTIMIMVVPGAVAVMITVLGPARRGVTEVGPTRPLADRIDELRTGPMRRLLLGVALYELSNIGAILLLLRTSWLAPHGAGPFGQAQFVAALYIVYHLSAALAAAPAGAAADERGAGTVISWGASLLLVAYGGFALVGRGQPVLMALFFVLAGAAAGAVDAAEYAGVGRMASRDARWTAFGVLAAIQSVGRIAATVTAGALWTFVSPTAGLLVTGPLLLAGIIYFTLRTEEAPRTPSRGKRAGLGSVLPKRQPGW
jgi:MFS family permease